MAHKTIVINFQEPVTPIQSFKNALHIFNIKRVHLNKVNAYVQFQKAKDYDVFRFTNAFEKIPSLHGATYHLVNPEFKWKFPSYESYTIQTLPKEERQDTQPGSQEEKQRQENAHEQNDESSENLSDEENEKQEKTLPDINEELKIQRLKEQQQRRSMQTEDRSSQISTQTSSHELSEKKYFPLQNRIRFIAENGKMWINKMINMIPQKEHGRIQDGIKVLEQHWLTILLSIVALIIFAM